VNTCQLPSDQHRSNTSRHWPKRLRHPPITHCNHRKLSLNTDFSVNTNRHKLNIITRFEVLTAVLMKIQVFLWRHTVSTGEVTHVSINHIAIPWFSTSNSPKPLSAWLRASATIQMRPALFWDITQRWVVILTSWPLKMGPICCPETSVQNYHSTVRNIPEERRSQEHSYWTAWKNYGASKRRYLFTSPHGVTSQKAWVL
jgi:hypothetical protein